jgi:hypothetical protein
MRDVGDNHFVACHHPAWGGDTPVSVSR